MDLQTICIHCSWCLARMNPCQLQECSIALAGHSCQVSSHLRSGVPLVLQISVSRLQFEASFVVSLCEELMLSDNEFRPASVAQDLGVLGAGQTSILVSASLLALVTTQNLDC